MCCPYCHEEAGDNSYCIHCGMPLKAGRDYGLESDDTNILGQEDEAAGSWSNASTSAGSYGYFGSTGYSSGYPGGSSGSSARSSYNAGSSASYTGSLYPSGGGSPYPSGSSMQAKKKQKRKQNRQPKQKKPGQTKRIIIGLVLALIVGGGGPLLGRALAGSGSHTEYDPPVADNAKMVKDSTLTPAVSMTDDASVSEPLGEKFSILDGKVSAAFTDYRVDRSGVYRGEISVTNETDSVSIDVVMQTLRVNGVYVPCMDYQANIAPGETRALTFRIESEDFNDKAWGKPSLIEAGLMAQPSDDYIGFGIESISYCPQGEDKVVTASINKDDYKEIGSSEYGLTVRRGNLVDRGNGEYFLRLVVTNDTDRMVGLMTGDGNIDGKHTYATMGFLTLQKGTGVLDLHFLDELLADDGIVLKTASQMEIELNYDLYDSNGNLDSLESETISIDLK